MERGHEFTVKLDGDGTYVVKLLEGVQIEQSDGVTIGRWPAFDLEADGDSEAEVCQELIGRLRERTGGDPGSPEFATFATYVRKHGIRLSEEEIAARELARLRDITVRWRVTDDEQYTVGLFEDVEVQRDGNTVTLRAFGLEGIGQRVAQAAQTLMGAVKEACGD
ncbi:hypothetical protein, partial [Mycobacterium sp.]|uniref:hypothetical protein n=1 Tax=Mycobacterium sp. TaxID=1785 RepID=UPI002DA6986B|nr:hypothetical protein [Mycobacterium sp.]